MNISSINQLPLDAKVIITEGNDLATEISSAVKLGEYVKRNEILSSDGRLTAKTIEITTGKDSTGEHDFPPMLILSEWPASISSEQFDYVYNETHCPKNNGVTLGWVMRDGSLKDVDIDWPKQSGTIVLDSMLSCDPISSYIQSLVAAEVAKQLAAANKA